MLKQDYKTVRAFAPATASNLAVGFDLLGMALQDPGDRVTLERCAQPGFTITSVSGIVKLPTNVKKNTATIALQAFWQDRGDPNVGFTVAIEKGIPLGSGMGGSAASAVAALTAANAFLESPATLDELLPYAVMAEGVVSKTPHADNAAPALWGGLVLSAPGEPVMRLPDIPLSAVLFCPNISVSTAKARQLLPNSVSLGKHVVASGRLAAWVQNCHQFDPERFAELMVDDIIEPTRLELWPHYETVKNAAIDQGALAVSISGSGPSVLAWVLEAQDADAVGQAMNEASNQLGFAGQYWLSTRVAAGAKVEEVNGCATTAA